MTHIDQTKSRRRFFSAAGGGILRGFALAGLIPPFLRRAKKPGKKGGGPLSVTINPMAVPRRRKDGRSHGH